jgi:hypothetical protein
MIVTIQAAKTQLSKLIEKACRGEQIVIARGSEPVVKADHRVAGAYGRNNWGIAAPSCCRAALGLSC